MNRQPYPIIPQTIPQNQRAEVNEKILFAIDTASGAITPEAVYNVHFVSYLDSIEQNLMALVLTKERLNEFIKSGEVKEQSDIFDEFDVSISVIESLLIKTLDEKGNVRVTWGSQRVAALRYSR